MRQFPAPHEVFTPGSLPLEPLNVYAPRREAELALRRFMNRQQVPVVYGGYGVGKTTLIKKFFEEEARSGTLVYIPSVTALGMADIFSVVLEHLNYAVEVETVTKPQDKIEGGFDLKVLKATVGHTEAVERKHQVVVSSPTDYGVLKILDRMRLTIVIDEMHKGSPQLRAGIANMVKAVKSANHAYPRIVLIGTTNDAESLVAADPGIDRYIKELPVPAMDTREARYIVTQGFSRVGIVISNEYVEKLVASAAGAPTIVHALCLDAAESVLRRRDAEVRHDDCVEAVRRYLNEHGRRLANAYLRAVETTGQKRYRKQILIAAADVENDYVTMEDLRARIAAALGEDTKASALSGPLRALKDPRYGPILQDVERNVGGARIFNLTAFCDPMMKSFIRFISEVEVQGLLPPQEELPATATRELPGQGGSRATP
jgi:hypothetical protein